MSALMVVVLVFNTGAARADRALRVRARCREPRYAQRRTLYAGRGVVTRRKDHARNNMLLFICDIVIRAMMRERDDAATVALRDDRHDPMTPGAMPRRAAPILMRHGLRRLCLSL